jgi:proton-dependent oligopeptide transporter, POT family
MANYSADTALPVVLEAEIKAKKDRSDPLHNHPIHEPLAKLSNAAITDGTDELDEKHDAYSESVRPVSTDDGLERPTEEELGTLRRVADKLPLAAMLVVVIEFAERFSYYGTTGPFTNFIQRPLPPGGNGAGAIDLSQPEQRTGFLDRGIQTAVAVTTFFSFWSYISPVLGAIVADQYWGRFKTICIFTAIVGFGHILLVCMSIPSVLSTSSNGAFGGFMVALLIMGTGTGGIKANVSPLVAEQYTKAGQWIETRKNGERVIVDANLTIQRIFLWFYFMINMGSVIGQVIAVYAAQRVGFWLAYLVPTIVYLLMPIVLWVGYKRYVKTAPRGSVILEALRVFRLAHQGAWSWNPVILFRNLIGKADWNAARPKLDGVIEKSGSRGITWDNDFVDEIRRALYACKVFILYPAFWISYNQMTNNLTNQAAYMTTSGVPNDLLNNFNPISIIILVPLMDRIVYPGLRRFGIVIRPVARMALGFIIASSAMVYCAVLQYFINKTSPCGKFGAECEAGVSPLSVWIQVPVYVLIGFAEIMSSVTALEYAYTKAPVRMKSIVFSLYFLTTAFSNLFNFALAPVSVDPFVIWNYTGCAGASFIAGIIFYFLFRHYDNDEDTINAIGQSDARRFD